MDGHGVLALVAPRACAVADGWTDHEGDLTFADEAAVKAARGVYALLGAPANLTLMCAPRRLDGSPEAAGAHSHRSLRGPQTPPCLF